MNGVRDAAGLNALLCFLIKKQGGRIEIDAEEYDNWAVKHGALDGVNRVKVVGSVRHGLNGRTIVLGTEPVSPDGTQQP